MNDFLIFLMSLCAMLGLLILLSVFPNEPQEPTKVCRDGKLYEVTTEGNITIYEKLPFMICEER